MGSVIKKDQTIHLNKSEVRGDVLRPSYGTYTSCIEDKKYSKRSDLWEHNNENKYRRTIKVFWVRPVRFCQIIGLIGDPQINFQISLNALNDHKGPENITRMVDYG